MQMPRMIGEWTTQPSVVDAGAASLRLSLILRTFSSMWISFGGKVEPAELSVMIVGVLVVVVVVVVVVVDFAQRQIVHPVTGSVSKPLRQWRSQSWSPSQYLLSLLSHSRQHWPVFLIFFSQLIALHTLERHRTSPFSPHSQCVQSSSLGKTAIAGVNSKY